MSIVFYYSPMSSATRIHWALEELKIPYEKVKVDTKAGDQRKPAYLKINPNGKVPALVDGGVPMFESLAMLIHLGETYGVENNLWPAVGTPERLQALSWTTWGTVTFATAVFQVIMNTAERFPAEAKNAAQAETAKVAVGSLLQILNAQLEGRSYLLGPDFTLVDVANASMIAFTMRAGIDLAPYPNVTAWFARSTQRPAMAVAAAG
ncbi:MAG: glutathione S-transferase family protein [Polyangiaceae bacterium]